MIGNAMYEFFSGIGVQEFILLAVVSTLLFGKRLPELGCKFAKWKRRPPFNPGDPDAVANGARLPKHAPSKTTGAGARPDDAVTNL